MVMVVGGGGDGGGGGGDGDDGDGDGSWCCYVAQDHVTDLLTTIDASQVNFDIVTLSTTFSLCSLYLVLR